MPLDIWPAILNSDEASQLSTTRQRIPVVHHIFWQWPRSHPSPFCPNSFWPTFEFAALEKCCAWGSSRKAEVTLQQLGILSLHTHVGKLHYLEKNLGRCQKIASSLWWNWTACRSRLRSVFRELFRAGHWFSPRRYVEDRLEVVDTCLAATTPDKSVRQK